MFCKREVKYNLRDKMSIDKQYSRTTLKSMCPTRCGVEVWRNLDEGIKVCKNLPHFKKVYKESIFFKYEHILWYFGPMNRGNAVALLQSLDNPNGTFLLRRSDHDSAGYVLSVRHFKVHQDKDKSFYIDTSTCFSSLRQLVAHYRKYTLAKTETLLGQPCPKPEFSDSIAQTYDLPKEEFVLEERLGGGPSSDVFRGTWKGQIRVAIKTFKDPSLTKQFFLDEVQPLKGLQHRHLVSLLAVCTESPPYYIVTELMEKGSLLLFLRGPEGQHQDIVSLMDIAAQVADGMSYLEKKDIIHGDLAAQNVLISDAYVFKVTDFGLAAIKSTYENDEESNSACRWSAPETISHMNFTSKSDVWSFGVLLYEIITFGGIPYKGHDSDVYDRVSEGYRMPCPPRCPAFLYRMMLLCWSAKAEDRPSFSALMKELDNIFFE
uniref:Tyrosine-protein kinase n=1 Tax=Neogobius melanostomus TaxID=47308 RepID=A0A8C6UKQ0_9GOBI